MKKKISIVLITICLVLNVVLILSISKRKNVNVDVIVTGKKVKKIEGTFSSSLDKLEVYYLALNGKKKIDFIFDYPDSFNKSVNLTSGDENIVKVEDGTLYGVGVGKTSVTATLADGNSKKYEILVTDLIVPPTLNKNK